MLDLAVFLLIGGFMLLVVVYGDGPERLGGQIMLFILAFSTLRMLIMVGPVDGFDVLGLVSDVLAFSGFLWIALFAWRFWPIWTASLQLLAIGAHFGPALELPIAPLAYAIMRTAPTGIAIITLVGATWIHQRKSRSGVNMPPWRTWSGPLNRIAPTRWQAGSSPNLVR